MEELGTFRNYPRSLTRHFVQCMANTYIAPHRGQMTSFAVDVTMLGVADVTCWAFRTMRASRVLTISGRIGV